MAGGLQAIDFVQMQGDDELWELLISLALGSAESTGAPSCMLAWHKHVQECNAHPVYFQRASPPLVARCSLSNHERQDNAPNQYTACPLAHCSILPTMIAIGTQVSSWIMWGVTSTRWPSYPAFHRDWPFLGCATGLWASSPTFGPRPRCGRAAMPS